MRESNRKLKLTLPGALALIALAYALGSVLFDLGRILISVLCH